jgi:hypothetical protein
MPAEIGAEFCSGSNYFAMKTASEPERIRDERAGRSATNRSLERGVEILRAFRPGSELLGNGEIAERNVRMAAYEPQRLREPATRELLERINVFVDPELDAAFPGRRGARVELVLRDGRTLTHLQLDRRGDPELPLGDADLEGKLMELASPLIGAQSARALANRLWTLDTSTTPP